MREDIEILLSFLNIIDRIRNADEIREDKERILTDFLKAYYSDMYEIEKLHLGDKYDKANKSYCVELKRNIFKTYWHNDESYYSPCSVGDRAEFDWNLVSNIRFFEKGDDDHLYLVSIIYQDIVKNVRVYLIEYKDGKLGIQQEFFEVI